MQAHELPLPTTDAIQRARKSAMRTRAAQACTACKSDKARCVDYRPCARCVGTNNLCIDSVRLRVSRVTQCVDASEWRIPPTEWLLVPAGELAD